jgi:hypothetical protein
VLCETALIFLVFEPNQQKCVGDIFAERLAVWQVDKMTEEINKSTTPEKSLRGGKSLLSLYTVVSTERIA